MLAKERPSITSITPSMNFIIAAPQLVSIILLFRHIYQATSTRKKAGARLEDFEYL